MKRDMIYIYYKGEWIKVWRQTGDWLAKEASNER
jgi:hypothetical protein